MCLTCEVTKKLTREEIPSPPKDGANCHGMFMEVRTKLSALWFGVVPDYDEQGARWDSNLGSIAESRLKELYPAMPVPHHSVLVWYCTVVWQVIYIKAVTQDKQELRSLYECPIYTTR